MPTKDQLNNYLERFYKEVMNGKKGNLFTRVEWLEEQIRNLKVGDITQFITNVISENKEIIQPSIAGGVTDPTDPTFSGIVISPSGQLIGGILYSFAIVVDGVVVTGFGDDGGDPVIVGNGNVISDYVPAEVGRVAIFSNVDGYHIGDGGSLGETASGLLFLDNTASGVGGYKSLNQFYSTVSSGSTSFAATEIDGMQTVEEYISAVLNQPVIAGGWAYGQIYLSSDVDGDVELQVEFYTRASGGTETYFANTAIQTISLTGTPAEKSFSVLLNGIEGLAVTDRIVMKVRVNVPVDQTVTIAHGSASNASYIRIPLIAPESAISDGDKGDVIVSGGGVIWTIDNDVVTFAKMQNIATDTFIGRDTAGTGDPEALSAATARTILNVEDGAEVNNISDANATDLTDGGDTTLHTHTIYMTHGQVMSRVSIGF